MNVKAVAIAVIVIVLVLIGLKAVMPSSIGGFSGTTMTFNRIVYNGVTYQPTSDTTAMLDPVGPVSGVAAQVAGQPQTINTEVQEPIVVPLSDGTNDGFYWEIQTKEVGVDFQNTGMGADGPFGMEFWLRIQNNYASVWLDDAESVGYVTEVWVKEYEVLQQGGSSSILPSARGTFFQLYAVEGAEIVPPKAFSQVFKMADLARFATSEIKFVTDNFRPLATLWSTTTAHVYVTINMRVIVAGLWHGVPDHWQGPAPNQGSDILAAILGMLMDVFLGPFFIIVLAIVALAGLFIVVRARR